MLKSHLSLLRESVASNPKDPNIWVFCIILAHLIHYNVLYILGTDWRYIWKTGKEY